ncbi:MAG TPA: 2-oxoglutarate dehydrogenase complex dihydrolipoyllysine-residue succinyltransferase [Gammaproteobacteria bacterium]|nr:2-oxoglutarate dehydrogenase complex dihydrolipoyllysine-residue succinyltransferase [Gammaproteobacteria bacterium]
MSSEIKVPNLPESVTDATVAVWHKAVGDSFTEGELLVDLETDKIMLEVPAPCDGKLVEIKSPMGSQVTSGEVLGGYDAGKVSSETKVTEQLPESASQPKEQKQEEVVSDASTAEPKTGPAVRRMMHELSVDNQGLTTSGPKGTVTKEDVISLAQSMGDRHDERVPMSRLRSTIAKRLVEAQQTAAILTTFNEVNMQVVMDLRQRYKASFEKKHGVKLGFMSFFVRACCCALQEFPEVNASLEGSEIIYHNYQDVGIAVSSPKGLVVPVLRNAESKSMAAIESEIGKYGVKAKEGKLTLDDMTGGTFTISNGGVFGSMLSTPILNPPQSAILGMHNIVKRAVVENDEIKIRPMMYLALSYDHRIIDGAQSVRFLVMVKEILEDPSRMLLDL